MKRRLLRVSIPLRRPHATATGALSSRELVVLRLEDDEANTGYGEAAPLPGYSAETLEQAVVALRADRADAGAPASARCCEELASADLAARREGRPVVEPRAAAVEVNLTLPAGPIAEVAERAAAGVGAGFGCFKLKVGLDDDRARARAVRERIGAGARLRIDANGAWSVDEAERAIADLAELDLELVEQPCRSLAELAELRARVDVPLAADELIGSDADVRAAAAAGACDLVCVKLATSGGIAPARAALREAERLGLGAYLASTLDGPWAIAAALQLAAAERVTAACGLATLDLFEEPWASALPAVERGCAPVPSGPGLGVELGAEALAGCGVEELEQ